MADFFSSLFSGGTEREAADANRGALGQYDTIANNALNSGRDNSIGALRGQSNLADIRLGQNYGLYDNMRGAGNSILDSGRANSLAALGQANAAYDPLAALGAEYGRGRSLYQDSLGINGAAGNQNAVNSFQTGPGYQWQMDQGIQAVDRARNARGMLTSGNTTMDEIRFGQGLANQEYGNWQNRLQGFVPLELQATQGVASGRAGVANNMANMYGQDTLSRLGLEQAATQGQAGSNTARSANDVALGNSLAGLYTQDASNRVSLAGNNASGQMSANNMQAQGEAQGARNGLNAALGLASLVAGMPMGGGGGGSFNTFSTGGGNPFPSPNANSSAFSSFLR